MDGPQNGEAKNGKERTQFKPGNKAAVGHGKHSFEALRRQCVRKALGIDEAVGIVERFIIAALDGDLAAAKFAFDYCGLKPVEEMSVDDKRNSLTPEQEQLARVFGDRLVSIRARGTPLAGIRPGAAHPGNGAPLLGTGTGGLPPPDDQHPDTTRQEPIREPGNSLDSDIPPNGPDTAGNG